MTTLYGIPNCDTIKRARSWLDEHEVDYIFHNYRKDGLSAEMLETFEQQLGWETLLNRRGTTWRKLPEAEKDNINRERALALLLEHPAMIKRPILELGNQFHAGFSESQYQQSIKQ